MPELPEVETLRQQLANVVIGKKIKSVTVSWPKMVSPLSVESFTKQLIGHKIIAVDRRAKMLVFKLSSDNKNNSGEFLSVHLKMTGQLIFRPQIGQLVIGGHPQKDGGKDLPNKHTHIIITFSDGSVLYFNDMRKFGWMRLVTSDQLNVIFKNYGVEALSSDFDFKYFKSIIDRYTNRKIKQILLDQTLVAGIGNIYADEACFATGVLPTRLAKNISDLEIKKLLTHIKRILKLSILKKGTSYSTYVNLDGGSGGFVPYLKVYGRKDQACKKCTRPISKDKVVGRGTHFCDYCQK
ncbi:DNA-formamidopyrimidine glycosylase [Candidatus Falkowbacteria bacterium]|uniref:DNA-formamidopyrimidine glycosylase n=1 Tax=Candidatus Buchananbacteria bacterium CG10_big_fil_rev_8_21_14_0_10_33_19 TaxID=1974525 RepID=A0A2H0W481_9BACT|nr:DNA-formamidopyrimidine glycosylase [Candidatus Falkowbacteria bacterium]PIS06155.1 MAG: DNA-formamidopyrimidine glycosylase [Candidatus Buchananbacteria bacterium CG10_big_fil_rev_8_21_14_0_10_33_19]